MGNMDLGPASPARPAWPAGRAGLAGWAPYGHATAIRKATPSRPVDLDICYAYISIVDQVVLAACRCSPFQMLHKEVGSEPKDLRLAGPGWPKPRFDYEIKPFWA